MDRICNVLLPPKEPSFKFIPLWHSSYVGGIGFVCDYSSRKQSHLHALRNKRSVDNICSTSPVKTDHKMVPVLNSPETEDFTFKTKSFF